MASIDIHIWDQLQCSLMEKISDRVEYASDEEIRPLWDERHGVCTSWAILVASKIKADPDKLSFVDAGHHRLAFTNCGIVIDSSARVALQLKNGVPKSYGKVTYTMEGIGQGQPSLSYRASPLKNRESHTNQNIARQEGAQHNTLQKPARRDIKVSSPGHLFGRRFVYVPVLFPFPMAKTSNPD